MSAKTLDQKNKKNSKGFAAIEILLAMAVAEILAAIAVPTYKNYRYLRINGGTTPDLNGKRRRDENANPVNSDYDLYSMGRDGKTSAQFTAKKARDNIVRANDGVYYGLAEGH